MCDSIAIEQTLKYNQELDKHSYIIFTDYKSVAQKLQYPSFNKDNPVII